MLLLFFRFIDGWEANLAETEAAGTPIRMDDGDGGREESQARGGA